MRVVGSREGNGKSYRLGMAGTQSIADDILKAQNGTSQERDVGTLAL